MFGSCCIVEKHWGWKVGVWHILQKITEAAEGEGDLSYFAEVNIGFRHCWTRKTADALSLLIHGWWQMPCGGGCSDGSRAEVNPSGLLPCGKILLPGWRPWLWRYVTWMLMYPRVGPPRNIKTTKRWIRLFRLKWIWIGKTHKSELFIAWWHLRSSRKKCNM